MSTQVTIGRIVLVKPGTAYGNDEPEVPAIVTAVGDAPRIDAVAFSARWPSSVRNYVGILPAANSEADKSVGTWRWPPKA